MSDSHKFSNIAFQGREFEGPYSREAIASLTQDLSGFAVDIGCGNGSVLQASGLTGIGIDLNDAAIEIAKQKNPQSKFYAGSAIGLLWDLKLRPDIAINIGASQALGSQREALYIFSGMLSSGKHLLFGDGIWDREPSAEYLEFLGAKKEDMTSLDQLISTAEEFGFKPEGTYHSSQQDWDSFEDHYYNTMIQWCDDNPDDPDADGFRERMTKWRQNYLTLGRGVLGFAMILFQKI